MVHFQPAKELKPCFGKFVFGSGAFTTFKNASRLCLCSDDLHICRRMTKLFLVACQHMWNYLYAMQRNGIIMTQYRFVQQSNVEMEIKVIKILSMSLWLIRFAIGACVFHFFYVIICRFTAGRARIPDRYFRVEMAGGLFFICCGAHFGCGRWGLLSAHGMIAFLYLGILTVIAFIDWNTRIIFDCFHIFIALLGIAAVWLWPEHNLMDRLIGAAAVAGPMLLLAFVVEGAFGGGDIKLMAVSGFLLGWRAVLSAILLGGFAGGAYCICMLAAKKLSRKDSFALGPFLAFGLGIALFWGDRIAELYLI